MMMKIFLLRDIPEIQTASAPQALLRRRRDRDRELRTRTRTKTKTRRSRGANTPADDGLVARLPCDPDRAHARPRDVLRRVHGARADDLASRVRAHPFRLRGRRQVRESELVAQRPVDVRYVVVVASTSTSASASASASGAIMATRQLTRPPRRVGLELRVSLVVVADAALVEQQRRRGLGRHARGPREVERDASAAYRDGAVARSRLGAGHGRRDAQGLAGGVVGRRRAQMRRGPPLFDAFLDGREPVGLVVSGEVVVVVAQEAAVDGDGVDQWDDGEESDANM